MKFVELHRMADGEPIYINPFNIDYIVKKQKSEATIVRTTSNVYVREAPDEIMKLIDSVITVAYYG